MHNPTHHTQREKPQGQDKIIDPKKKERGGDHIYRLWMHMHADYSSIHV